MTVNLDQSLHGIAGGILSLETQYPQVNKEFPIVTLANGIFAKGEKYGEVDKLSASVTRLLFLTIKRAKIQRKKTVTVDSIALNENLKTVVDQIDNLKTGFPDLVKEFSPEEIVNDFYSSLIRHEKQDARVLSITSVFCRALQGIYFPSKVREDATSFFADRWTVLGVAALLVGAFAIGKYSDRIGGLFSEKLSGADGEG